MLDKVIEVVVDQLDCDAAEVKEDSKFIEDLGFYATYFFAFISSDFSRGYSICLDDCHWYTHYPSRATSFG